MDFFDALILGLIQGLTEFLPISSSGHLVIGQALLGLAEPGVSLEIWLHVGTLLAVVAYFRRRVFAIVRAIIPGPKTPESVPNRRLLWILVIGTIPAVAAVLLFRSYFELAYDSPPFASIMLIVTGIFLLLTFFAANRARAVGFTRGFLIGLAQAAAILPGISRSGATISCALFLGVSPAVAAEFSFLLAVPAIAGAFVYDLIFSGAAGAFSGDLPLYFAGALVSFIVGILAIHYLLRVIRAGRFYLFGLYCLVAGTISFILLY